MLDGQSPRLAADGGKHDSRLDVALAKKNRIATGIRNPRHDSHPPVEILAHARGIEGLGSSRSEEESGREPKGNDDCESGYNSAGIHELSLSSAAELISISPSREFRTKWLSNTNELESLAQSREADLVGGDAMLGSAICALTFLDCFPPLLNRREVPPFALPADYPQSPLRRIECESAANRKMLYRLVSAEIGFAEETGGIHARVI
jgi:hypothetical protein